MNGNMSADMRVACIGDSLTECEALAEGEKWPALLEAKLGCPWVNFGIGGDTTAGMLSRFHRELAAGSFTHCFIMGGTNDLWFGLTWKELLPNIYAMISQLRFRDMEPLIGIPPQIIPPGLHHWQFPPEEGYNAFAGRILEYRRRLIDICKAEALCCADIYTAVSIPNMGAMSDSLVSVYADPTFFLDDGLHFNPLGSQTAAACIQGALKNHGIRKE